jgi:hypothetical protein
MGSPSPFQVGMAIGSNIGQGFQAYQDRSALDDILMKANQTNDPNAVQDAMQQILTRVSPEKREGAMQLLQQKQKKIQDDILRKQKQQSFKEAGISPALADLDPQIAKEVLRGGRINELLGGQNPYTNYGGQPPQSQPPQGQVPPGRPYQPQGTPPQRKPFSLENIKQATDDELNRLLLIPDAKDVAKEEMARRREALKVDQKMQMVFHKDSADFVNALRKSASSAQKQLSALGIAESAIKTGNVKPTSIANIFKGQGEFGDTISNAFLSGDEAKIGAVVPYLLEGWKDIFGVRLSDADLRVLQDKLPSIGKTPEANMAIIGIMKKYTRQNIYKAKIASQLEKENEDIRPKGFERMVEDRFEKGLQPVRIRNPINGNIIEIPQFELADALNSGAELVDE